MRRALPVLLGAAASLTCGAAALSFDGWFPLRVGLIAGGALYALFAARVSERLLAWLPARSVAALAGGVLAGLALLDFLLASGDVYARGLLFAAFYACVSAVLVFLALRGAAADGRAARAVRGSLVLLGATAAVLALVEHGFRVRFPLQLYEIVPDDRRQGDSFVKTADGLLVGRPDFRGEYRHPEFPGVRVELNAWGLRDGLDEATPAAPGDLSLLVLGDSMAFGCGVPLEATFQEQLEVLAAPLAPPPLRIYCAAMPGNGQFQELADLERLAADTRPRAVIVAFYMGNDIADNLGWEFQAAAKQGTLPAALRKPPPVPDLEHRLPRFLRGIRHLPFWLGGSSTVNALLPGLEATLVERGLAERFVPTNGFLTGCMKRELPFEQQLGRERTLLAFDTLRDRCRALGAEPVALVIPAAIQASPPRFADFARTLGAAAATVDRRAFFDDFVRRLAERGWRVADPIAALESAESAGRACYFREGHWNAEGHRLAAETLAATIRNMLQPK